MLRLKILISICVLPIMSYEIEKLPGPLCILGEGPHWDSDTQSLYFVDIYKGTINRYSYEEEKVYSSSIGNESLAAFIIPIDGHSDRFAVGLGRRVGIVQWDGKSNESKVEKILFEIENEEEYKDNRLNDAKADSSGRLFFGTMCDAKICDTYDSFRGGFYRKDVDVQKLRSNVGISNGMAWNEKTNKMYYIDSLDFTVREFNYSKENGAIDEGEILIDFRKDGKSPGFNPDGMTIDSEGNLYVATFGGSKILKVDPVLKKVVMTIDFPCEQITSCAFGGPNLDILYVTTSNKGSEPKPEKPSPAGATFQVTGLQAIGAPMYKVKLS